MGCWISCLVLEFGVCSDRLQFALHGLLQDCLALQDVIELVDFALGAAVEDGLVRLVKDLTHTELGSRHSHLIFLSKVIGGPRRANDT